MSSKSRQDLENWLKTIEVNGNVLDIGGSQNPIITRVVYGDIEFSILDLKTPHECKIEPHLIGDIQEKNLLDLYSDYRDEFDVAFCIEVSEYWYDPLSALKNINKFLKKDGILYISFHTSYGLHNPKGEDCLRYTKNAIEKLAKKTGFEIEEMTKKELTPEGKRLYYQFCKAEGMRLDYNDEETYVEGYLCKMRKI